MAEYGFIKEIEKSVEEVEQLAREALDKQGFGILTRIDMQEKFKDKLGKEFKKYLILGACNPPNAFNAVSAEENIGLLLPCNVIIYEKDNKTVIGIIKPTVAMSMVDNEQLAPVAAAVEQKLQLAFDEIL